MKCDVVSLPGGGRAFVCGARARNQPRCAFCDDLAKRLCDKVVGTQDRGIAVLKLTCDKPLCLKHVFAGAEGRDVCPEHRPSARAPDVPRGTSPAVAQTTQQNENTGPPGSPALHLAPPEPEEPDDVPAATSPPVELLAGMAEGRCQHQYPGEPMGIVSVEPYADRAARLAAFIDGNRRAEGSSNYMATNRPDRTYIGLLGEVVWALVRGLPVREVFEQPDDGRDFDGVNVKTKAGDGWPAVGRYLDVNDRQHERNRIRGVARYGLAQVDLKGQTGRVVCSVSLLDYEARAFAVTRDDPRDNHHRLDGLLERQQQQRSSPDVCVVCCGRKGEPAPAPADRVAVNREGVAQMRAILASMPVEDDSA
jgi:hypothetical protein